MMTYGSLILAALKIVLIFFQRGQEREWMQQGEEKAFAKEMAETLRKSEYGKQALAEAAALSDDDLDRRLRDFEPGDPDRK